MPHMSVEDAHHYETRCLAFIDILGFSELIKESQGNHERFLWLRSLFMEFESVGSHIAADNTAMAEIGKILPTLRGKSDPTHMVAFSDSIVLSTSVRPSCEPAAVFALAQRTADLCTQLLHFGCLTRGGITIGDLFHESNVVFGPALLDAYKLESQVAVYPRILFSDDAVRYINDFQLLGSDQRAVIRDRDGLPYLNVLAWAVSRQNNFDDDSFDRIRDNLIALRGTSRDLRAHAKIEWYVDYFNDTVDLLNKCNARLCSEVQRIP